MSEISSLFVRYVNFTNEVNAQKDVQKEDKKVLEEELKNVGISGARKKAFMHLVKEETMDEKQKATKDEVEAEIEYLRNEIR